MLRDYQIKLIEDIRASMREGCKSILLQSPTGSGKTILTAFMLKTAAEKGMHSWFVVHRRELIKQSTIEFSQIGVKNGIISNGFMEDGRYPIQIGSVQTLIRRHKKLKPPKFIIWDECHHCAAKSWSELHNYFPNSFHVGLTATPERLDGKGLGKWFKKMVNGPSVSWLIENGFLSPYKLYAPPGIVTQGLHTRMGDYAKEELVSVSDKPSITGDAIKHYKKLCEGKRAVVFCVSIEHSKHVVEQFNAEGITAAHVDGETETDIRDEAVKKFREGKIKVLSNVELFGEGFDLCSLEAAILLRPTQSLGLYLQQIGRSLRPFEGKNNAIILDHAGNCQRHGLPDEEREWSLDGEEGRTSKSQDKIKVKICPKCYGAQTQGSLICIVCGYKFEIKERKIAHVDGELIEIDPEKLRWSRRKEQAKTQTYDDLVRLGRARGYKRAEMWAAHIMRARQIKKLMGVA